MIRPPSLSPRSPSSARCSPRWSRRHLPRRLPPVPHRPCPPTPGRARSTSRSGTVLMYQPQVNKWEGNQIDFRAALAIKPKGGKAESFGVMFATARTQVDKVNRTVVFENLKITKSDFPDAARPRRGLRGRTADRDGERRAHDRARPPDDLARAQRHQAADGGGAEQPAEGLHQQLAGHPGADRRRAGASSRCPDSSGFAARDQHQGG